MRVLVVNIFFDPYSFGGATVVADATATRALPDPLGGTIPASVVHRTALSELADRFAIVVKDTAALLPQQAA